MSIPGKSDLDASYHVEMLSVSGFVHSADCTTMDGHDWRLSRLTGDGHELLDSIRDDTVWAKTKEVINRASGWTIPILQAFATDLLKKQIGLH